MPARSTLMRLHNRTPHTLTRKDHHLDGGEWTDPNYAPEVINPGQTVFIQSESDGIATGTEGTIRYVSSGGGELFFHWNNPYVGRNSYSQAAPAGCGLAFSGGTGNNAELDLQLVTSAKVTIPNFSPSANGFLFSNSWPDQALLRLIKMPDPFGDITIGNASNGICGGMAYAVADYYLAGMVPTRSKTHPKGIGDPLYDYLVERLFDSFDLPAGPLEYWQYMNPAYPDTPRVDAVGRAWVMAHEAFPAVMASIDAGRPCPLGLVMVKSLSPTDLGKNHQVLAYAYMVDGGRATIWVYDPNSPGQDSCIISFDLSDASNTITVNHNVDVARPIYTFFTTAYGQDAPPPPGRSRAALDAFWLGGDGAVATNWANPEVDEARWHDAFPITPPGASRADSPVAAITRFNGAMDAFWIGPDGAIATNWENPAVDNANWHAPFPITPPGAAGPGSPIAVLTRFNGALDVFWLGGDGAVATNWANPDVEGGRWHDAFPITPPGAARGDSGLAAVTRFNGAMDAFWIGPDGAIATNWANPDVDNAAWHHAFPITPPGAARVGSGLAAITRFNGALDVFWIGPDGAVATNWANPDVEGGRWHDAFPITPPGAARADSKVAVVTRFNGAMDVFWIGPDGAIATNWANPDVDNGAWHAPFPITPPGAAGPGSPIAAVTRFDGALDVFWIGGDGAIATNWANPEVEAGKWHNAFPITPPGAARGGSPLAALSR